MATVEYAAIAVLVSAVLAVGGAALDAERVPAAVGLQLRRAMCLVAGGDCLAREGPRPCVVRATTRARDTRVSVALLRLRDGRTVLREERSDGTVRVTVVQADRAGAGADLGGRVTIGGRGVKAGVEVAGTAGVAYGRAYVLPDGARADALITRLARDDAVAGGALGGVARFLLGRSGDGEDERFAEVRGGAEAEAALGALGVGASATLLRDVTGGVRIDRAGRRTVTLVLDRAVQAALGAPLAWLGAGASAATGFELALGRDGRPETLIVRRSADVRVDARLGPFASAGGDRAEVDVRLDLADGRARALLHRALRADAGAARELAGVLATSARIDVRRYATTHGETTRGGSVALLGRLGVEVVSTTGEARLVAAAGREPGLGWSRRLDCLGVA